MPRPARRRDRRFGIVRRQPPGEARRRVLRARRRQDRRREIHRPGDCERRGRRRRRARAACHRAFRSSSLATPAARWRCAAARFYPRQPQTIAAVTGTSGKTSVAAFTRQIWMQRRLRCRQHRHHRSRVAEAHGLRLADDARSDLAAQDARRDRGRGRDASGVRGVVAWSRSASAGRRARRCRRVHQSLARPHGLSSDRRALSRRKAAPVHRSREGGRYGGDRRRSRAFRCGCRSGAQARPAA